MSGHPQYPGSPPPTYDPYQQGQYVPSGQYFPSGPPQGDAGAYYNNGYGQPQQPQYPQHPYQQPPYHPTEEQRGDKHSGSGGGICAGIMAALACCCCLDILF